MRSALTVAVQVIAIRPVTRVLGLKEQARPERKRGEEKTGKRTISRKMVSPQKEVRSALS